MESSMLVVPHPLVMTMVATQRQADFLAQADRDRLARRAQTTAEHRLLWSERSAALGLVLALALPFQAAYLG
jgi:hypothetical protein